MMKRFLIYIAVVLFICPALMAGENSNRHFWHGKERQLRYQPDGEDFVIVNGNKKFNRALYGTHTAFRVETGDLPEFGLFMPHMGGNFHFGLVSGSASKWINDASHIESRYRPGARLYEIKDAILGNGKILLHVLAMDDADGMILKADFVDVPQGVELVWVFGGASNRRFSRSGDLGVDPEDSFELLTEYCRNNVYTLNNNRFKVFYGVEKQYALAASLGQLAPDAEPRHTPLNVSGVFPEGSLVRIGDAENRRTPAIALDAPKSDNVPVLVGKKDVKSGESLFFSLHNPATKPEMTYADLPGAFQSSEATRQELASRIKLTTPDPFFNTLGGTMTMAADGIWEPNSFHHGAIGWRMRLNGWRGPYSADVLGWHDRAQGHFNAYANSQVTEVPPIYPHPTQDMELNRARSEKRWGTQMYSNGYICRNPDRNDQMHHYDMNLCYIDELLWHFNWTGDLDYVKEMWPVLALHLEWEKRNFDPNDDGLYDAYASIWASDALQYNSGGVTHSSAYNYRANRMAAELAAMIGENPEPYRREADKILNAINSRLWMPERGWWAEYQDFMGHKKLHKSAGIWTVYHAIDSDVHDNFQAYQAVRYVDKEIPHIAVNAIGLEEGYETISTTNWLPYSWSINNVAFGEVGHTALSFWQAGQNEKAFHLLKSSLLDGMYIGASPGNIGQISFYDAARGECYRDFADPVGVTTRTVIQGLYGIIPDALNDRLVIRPGFPEKWEYAALETPYIKYDFKRQGSTDTYKFKQSFQKELTLELQVVARFDKVAKVTVNGKAANWEADRSAVGEPVIRILCGNSEDINIEIEWSGSPVFASPMPGLVAKGDALELIFFNEVHEVFDPQGVFTSPVLKGRHLSGIVNGLTGHRTLFVQVTQNDLAWWMPVELEIVEPLVVEAIDQEKPELQIQVTNNSVKPFSGLVVVNPGRNEYRVPLTLNGGEVSRVMSVPAVSAMMGTNEVKLLTRERRFLSTRENTVLKTSVINWEVANQPGIQYEPVNISAALNDKVTQIFQNEYLSPRSPYTTLQVPVQGIGEWCHPNMTANIDDSGFRSKVSDGLFTTPQGVVFRTEGTSGNNNIAYTSLWDIYPDKISVPVSGKASHAYLLMAGSTNHMQVHFVNGVVRVKYTDGTEDILELINPESWCPIEQDFFVDGEAFSLKAPRPYRVHLKSGLVSRFLGEELGIRGVEPRRIDGGAAVILDIPLDRNKVLRTIELESKANEVVIGLMGVTLVR